ncbi:ABC transporter permease [Cytophagales bacterium WSM2-2]|nr:ABC transporter permease [Cytophagales bacterium WSM2-2]
MLKHFIIASRFLFNHREYSLINIGGLAVSLVAVFFISLYLFDELSFDRNHANADRIYRVIEHQKNNKGEETDMAGVAFLTAQIRNDIPAVGQTVKMTVLGRANISNSENANVFYEDMNFADQGLLNIFDFPLIEGQRENALSKPYTVLLTKSSAIRIFGTEKAVGKVLLSDRSNQPYTITGVLEDFPSNSHLQMNIIFSMASNASQEWYKRSETSDWSSNYFSTYYLLKSDADANSVSTTLTSLAKKNRAEKASPFYFWLQPLKDIHFHSASIRGGFSARSGEITYVYIFGAVGLFILLIALVNYVNLSTSLSINRGKEIGVKKVAGAYRSQLIFQFIAESNLVVFIAVILALGICNALLPAFNTFSGKTISMSTLVTPSTAIFLTAFTFFTGLLAGSYPAFYLSRMKPVEAIKGYSKMKYGSAWMRRGLVVFQFFLSIALIIATLTARQQIEYVNNKNLGFNQDQLIILDINSRAVRRGFETIKTELSKLPSTKSVTVSSRVPGEWKNLARVKAVTANEPTGLNCYFIGADQDFLRTFEISLLKGRNFREAFPADSSAILINETAASLLGIREPGDAMTIPSVNMAVSDEALDQPFKVNVIGIVKDFHFQSLHQKIAPMIIAYQNNPVQAIDYFTVRSTVKDLSMNLEAMQAIFYKVDNKHLLEYNFLDQRLANFYENDQKRSRLFVCAAAVAIALACLGLFSLASFNTAQRTKEIGIRKVLGASVSQVSLMLSKEYLRLVSFGFLFAIPVSYFALSSWLNSFAYHIEIGSVIILLAGIISISIALITVGYKSMQAALANPVKSLRSE